jgi:bleomycin hydrolase
MTRRKKIIITIIIIVLVLPILAIGTIGILATLFPSGEHTFTHELLLPMTPVKDQGDTEFCWAYAMLATIETEHILRGDSVNLSPQYLGRMLKKYQKSKFQDSGFKSTERGMGQTALNLLEHYGLVGYDVMPDDATADLPTPKNVYMLGAKYTPLEFAHSVCAPDEYIGLTSFPDSPYYKKIDVPIPDNWEHNRLLNIPLDSLRRHVNRALHHRHPVCYENRAHAMAIVGKAHDEENHPYYIMKNSWGTNQPYGGLVYIPTSLKDAVAVYMTRNAYEGK